MTVLVCDTNTHVANSKLQDYLLEKDNPAAVKTLPIQQ